MENYDPAFNSGARAGGMSLSCAILPSWEMELTFNQTSSYQASTSDVALPASKPQPLSSQRSCLWSSVEALATLLLVVTQLTMRAP